MDHFNRTKITNKDINCALKEKKSLSKMVGLKQPYQNRYKKKSKNWKLVNKKLVIRNEIKNLDLGSFKPLYPLSLEFDWMSIGGRVPNTVENSTLVNKHSGEDSNSKKSIKVRLMNGEREQKLAVKEISPNLLSVVMKKFLNFFRKLKNFFEHFSGF